MDFKTFIEEIKTKIESKCPDKEVAIQEVFKNNDIKLVGLTILEKDSSLSPTLYLEEYYKEYCSGADLEFIADSIIIEWNRHFKAINYNIIESLINYEMVKDNITLKLINKKLNVARLNEIPYENFLDDFALICSAEIRLGNNNELEKGSINVNNSLLSQWNISKEEMFKQAYDNTERLCEPLIIRMDDLIFDIIRRRGIVEPEMRDVLQNLIKCKSNMFILTNKIKLTGAVMVIFDKVLEMLASRIGKSFYMIPSSIHEWIIIDEEISEDNTINFTNILNEVNKNEVDEQEILSDNLYMYDFDEKRIKRAQ